MPETTEIVTESQSKAPDHIAGSPRILIIDDEAAIRESLDTLLTLEGFSVSMASDGPTGMELTRKTSMTCSYSTWHSQVKVASISCRASSKRNPIFPSS